jgi:heterodisulfide reductase subunit A
LLTLSEVVGIDGAEGNFTVTVRQNPRYVDADKCTACGTCAQKCPRTVADPYQTGLGKRKAAYVTYAQAIPLVYAIDSANCIYFLKGKCKACQQFCPTGAVDFEQQPKDTEIRVGSLILAPGFQPYDPTPYEAYEYYGHPNVLTSLEFERLLAATGPTMGHVLRPSDDMEPKKIAFLQCVGSRDINPAHCDHPYCSSVCCMYAIKEAAIAREHAGGDLDVSIFYMDMRTHGKDFDKYYEKAKAGGINFIRSRIHSVDSLPNDDLLLGWADEQGVSRSEKFDMVVLSVGLEINDKIKELAAKLGVELDEDGFARTDSFRPVDTSVPGIYSCGVFSGPKDIPVSVMEASAAAGAATAPLASARATETREAVIPEQINVAGDPPRVGVFVCSCGINIAGVVDVQAVAEFAKRLPFVEYVGNNLFTCSQDTQDKMAEVIKEQGLNRIVVAACTPRTHEPLFQETMTGAGLNKFLIEMANIRNQDSWVHPDAPEKATEKAKDLVRMAVAKAALLKPLAQEEMDVRQSALIIGGGVAGMVAARDLARQGYPVHLIERTDTLGGQANNLLRTFRGQPVGEFVEGLVAEVGANDLITVHKQTEVAQSYGFVGNFKTTLASGGKTEEIEHGVVIMATGAKQLDPSEYLYGTDDRVVTSLRLDRMFKENDPVLDKVKSAVFIQCVGSREPERPYCSKVCCTHSVENALEFKDKNPETDVFVLYRDIRTFGQRERLYKQAREKRVVFVRFDVDHKPRIETEGDRLTVTVRDHILGRDLILRPDLVCLASAIESYRDEELAKAFKVPLDDDGWFVEAHPKLRPVDFATDGVFVCGMAHYPKPIEESIAQAQAAAARAVTVMAAGRITVGGQVAEISPVRCVGCGLCVEICPYSAIALDEKNIAVVNEALCKGCGTCVAACRSGAPSLRGFTNAEVFSQIEAAL